MRETLAGILVGLLLGGLFFPTEAGIRSRHLYDRFMAGWQNP